MKEKKTLKTSQNGHLVAREKAARLKFLFLTLQTLIIFLRPVLLPAALSVSERSTK